MKLSDLFESEYDLTPEEEKKVTDYAFKNRYSIQQTADLLDKYKRKKIAIAKGYKRRATDQSK